MIALSPLIWQVILESIVCRLDVLLCPCICVCVWLLYAVGCSRLFTGCCAAVAVAAVVRPWLQLSLVGNGG